MSARNQSPITRRLGVTPRIKALAAGVPLNTRVLVDVGTNHGILPIAVLRAGRARRCVAIDKSAVALAEARRRLRRSRCEERVALLQGDGLAPIAVDKGEIDVVCMAGLGGNAIAAMLEHGLARLALPRLRLLLNPLGSTAAPRAWLAAHGFALDADFTVQQRGRDYPILVASRR